MEIDPEKLPPSEYSQPFLDGMLYRMAVSFHKYGARTGSL